MTNNTTHIISNSQGKSHLSRYSNGQVFAYRKGVQVLFGEDPRNMGAREFTSEEHAMECLHHLAHLDQALRIGKVCRDCGLPQSDRVSCPKNNDGAHRTEMRNVPVVEIIDGDLRVLRPN